MYLTLSLYLIIGGSQGFGSGHVAKDGQGFGSGHFKLFT